MESKKYLMENIWTFCPDKGRKSSDICYQHVYLSVTKLLDFFQKKGILIINSHF